MPDSAALLATAIAMGTDGRVILGSGATFGILMVWEPIHISFYFFANYLSKQGHSPHPGSHLLSRDAYPGTHDCRDDGHYQ